MVPFSVLFPVKQDAERISKYKEHIDKVKYDKINFPVKLKDISKNKNMNDIKFNIFGVDDKQSFYPFYISNKICDKTCNLLLIENGNENNYVWIKDFNKLMNSQSKNGQIIFFFVIIVYNILYQKKYWKIMLMVALKLMEPKK